MPKQLNLIGQTFGRLTVIEKTDLRKRGSVIWKCKCACGKEHLVATPALTTGQSKSCGCLHKEIVSQTMSKAHDEIIGQRFGKLIALRKDKNHKAANGSYMIECKCDCGNIVFVPLSNLQNHHTNSCGCLNMSIGELKIYQLLTENNIPFEQEKKFEDCRSPITNYPLRFDFYVNNQYLIEYDGRQHQEADGGWGEPLENIIARDAYKTKWCKEHNIPLIRISYKDYENLTIQDLLL